MRHSTVFYLPGDLARWICVPLCTNIFLFAELMGMFKFSHVKIVFEEGKGGNIYICIYLLVFPRSPVLLCISWHGNNYFSVLCIKNNARCLDVMYICVYVTCLSRGRRLPLPTPPPLQIFAVLPNNK
jgi:hypothetical protein